MRGRSRGAVPSVFGLVLRGRIRASLADVRPLCREVLRRLLGGSQAEKQLLNGDSRMKARKPIRKRRSKPRRVIGREKLYGKAKEARRREIFERSGGRCEESQVLCEFPTWSIENGVVMRNVVLRCNRPITWESMEWSHNRHGANKDDSMSGGIASCRECHDRRHHPKACPPKRVA